MPLLSRWPPLVRAVTIRVSAFSPFERDEFLAVDDPARALLLGGGGNVGEIVARVLLELREGKGLAAVDDAGNMRSLLLGRAAVAQEAAADHDRREIRLQHQRLAERLHHDHGFDRAGAEAAIGFRERQSEQALLGELAPDGLAPAALLLLVFLARIEIVGVVQEPVDAFLEKPLLLGQIKIHVLYFPTSMSSWPGLPRPSTTSDPQNQDVDARASPGMTVMETTAPAPPW